MVSCQEKRNGVWLVVAGRGGLVLVKAKLEYGGLSRSSTFTIEFWV